MKLLLVLLAACGGSSSPGTCDPTADTCAGNDICLVDTCAGAFPLSYEVTQIHATAPTAHDLQVVFAVGTVGQPPAPQAMTAVASGQREATFEASLLVELGAQTDALSAELIDATTGDRLLACVRSPIDMDRLRERDDNCDKEGFALSYEIAPLVAVPDYRWR